MYLILVYHGAWEQLLLDVESMIPLLLIVCQKVMSTRGDW